MRKGVAYLFRYRDVSRSANARYLDALAVVSDPTAKVRELDRITRRVCPASGRTERAFMAAQGAHSILGCPRLGRV